MHLPGFRCAQMAVGLQQRGPVEPCIPIGGVLALSPEGRMVEKGLRDKGHASSRE